MKRKYTTIMNRSKFLLLATILLSALAACNKVSESIQRDLITTPTPLIFNIPIANTLTPIQIDTLPVVVSISNTIAEQTKGEFTVNELTKVKLSSFLVDLVLSKTDTIDTKNNLGNIESIKVMISGGGSTDSLAKVSNTSDAVLGSLTLTPQIAPDKLKAYLSSSDLKYKINIKVRTPTTRIITARATPVYTLTLQK